MKKLTKIISVALVLVLALSVMVMPASAATPTIKADVVAEYQGQTSAGYDYYKFSVYLDSTLSLVGFQLNLTWDNAVWQVLRASNKADWTRWNVNIVDQDDEENIFYDAHPDYADYGDFVGWDCADTADGYAYIPADGAAPTIAQISDTNMGSTLKDAGYTGMYSAWAIDWNDTNLCVSGGSLNGVNAPASGRVMVLSWYMRLKDGVTTGNFEVGFNASQEKRLTGTYCTEDAIASNDVGSNMASIDDSMVTYSNAVVTLAEDSIINPWKDQIRFNANAAGTALESVDYRTLAQISAEDFAATFTDEATAKTMIKEIGFVYATGGTIDKTAAMTQVETGTGSYTKKTVSYISNSAADGQYVISCLVEDVNVNGTLSALAYVAYDSDADGVADAYAYYPTVTTSNINTLYTTYYSQWCAQNGITA